MQFPVLDVSSFNKNINEKLYKNKIVRHFYIIVEIRLFYSVLILVLTTLYASTPIQRFPRVLVNATKAKVAA